MLLFFRDKSKGCLLGWYEVGKAGKQMCKIDTVYPLCPNLDESAKVGHFNRPKSKITTYASRLLGT